MDNSYPTREEEKTDGATCRTDRKNVRFSTIEFREFNRTLGCNPACTDGPPISLDWEYVHNDPVTLDEYEGNRLPRRPRHHLILSTDTRRNILSRHFGHTEGEIKEVEDAMKLIRKKRMKTKNEGPLVQKTRILAESARNVLTSPFRRKVNMNFVSDVIPQSILITSN